VSILQRIRAWWHRIRNRQDATRRTPPPYEGDPADAAFVRELVYVYGKHRHHIRWRTHADLDLLLAGLPVDGESLDELGYLAIVMHAGEMAGKEN